MIKIFPEIGKFFQKNALNDFIVTNSNPNALMIDRIFFAVQSTLNSTWVKSQMMFFFNKIISAKR